DVVTTPLMHDTPNEIATTYGIVKDWTKSEIEAIPGKTMPNFTVVERDYKEIYNKFVSVGPLMREGKVGAHGVAFSVKEQFDELQNIVGTHYDDTLKNGRPKIETAKQVADVI